MFNQATYCKNTLNEWGAERKPFLFIIDFAIKKPRLIPLDKTEAFCCYAFNQVKQPTDKLPGKISLGANPISYSDYLHAFQVVQKNIKQGNTFLLNLTQATPIETPYSLKELYDLSNARYKLLLYDKFVVFSPETFVRIDEKGTISSYPMKGTIDAALPDAAAKLLADPKEKAEHATIVDLIRNDLSLVAKEVSIEKYRYVEEIKTSHKTLLQVSSKVSGKLSKDWHGKVGSVLMTMLPAGSISGAPKKKTVQIIEEAEGYDRGYYTGVAGIYDGHTLDSFVMIRFIEKSKNTYLYKSGGGITSFSDPEKEYQELIDKIYVPIS